MHEDEEGQLYFKDANGTLQPVYLTEDGNYAIAETNNEDEIAKESSLSKSQQNNSMEEDTYILPEVENPKSPPNKQVTIH